MTDFWPSACQRLSFKKMPHMLLSSLIGLMMVKATFHSWLNTVGVPHPLLTLLCWVLHFHHLWTYSNTDSLQYWQNWIKYCLFTRQKNNQGWDFNNKLVLLSLPFWMSSAVIHQSARVVEFPDCYSQGKNCFMFSES